MKRNLYVLLSLLVLASMALAACGAPPPKPPRRQAPATEAPATEAPTAAPTEAPAEPTPFPMSRSRPLTARRCLFRIAIMAAIFKSIEATDQYTVTFNLCKPDPAFLTEDRLQPLRHLLEGMDRVDHWRYHPHERWSRKARLAPVPTWSASGPAAKADLRSQPEITGVRRRKPRPWSSAGATEFSRPPERIAVWHGGWHR